jgi:pimeloyl-ACP methyl ester carboxylesterase
MDEVRFTVDAIYDVAPGEVEERILLLMLPGAKNTPQQLVENGFIRALRERNLPVDVLALNAHVDLYLDRSNIERLLHRTMDEIRTLGYGRIWLLGISLGGSGAMICVTQRTPEIEGVFLLAPFLGTRGLIAEAEAAGGLHYWHAGEIESRDHERELLDQIRRSPLAAEEFPTVYLGYGSEDRYRGASVLLSDHLPKHRVVVTAGGHDWETWIVLWNALLDKRPFLGACGSLCNA